MGRARRRWEWGRGRTISTRVRRHNLSLFAPSSRRNIPGVFFASLSLPGLVGGWPKRGCVWPPLPRQKDSPYPLTHTHTHTHPVWPSFLAHNLLYYGTGVPVRVRVLPPCPCRHAAMPPWRGVPSIFIICDLRCFPPAFLFILFFFFWVPGGQLT